MKSAWQKERELIISLYDKGDSTYQIADILGISQTKASFWVRRFNETGSLENKSRSGRPSPLKKKLSSIAKVIKQQVLNSEGKSGISSKEVLQIVEEKIGKRYTLRHAQRLLHKMGFSLVTPRVSHIKKDKVAQEKFRQEFKKNLRKNMWTIPS